MLEGWCMVKQNDDWACNIILYWLAKPDKLGAENLVLP